MTLLREPRFARQRPTTAAVLVNVAAVICIIGMLVVIVMAIAAFLRWQNIPPQKPRSPMSIQRLASLVSPT